jgi:(4S)-4-hydroxy-5-phosphonooxypentane-2,3-dione isomerase
MATVLAARWRALEGKEELIAEILRIMTPLSRSEPGCLFYQPHRSVDDPQLFFLYEQYSDQAAVDAHRASPHFQEHVIGKAIPNLESRVVDTFVTDGF